MADARRAWRHYRTADDWPQARALAAEALGLEPGNAVAHFAPIMRPASGEFIAAEHRARQVRNPP
jgi:hypothetical protein